MTNDFANLLDSYIAELPFADKHAGLVRTVTTREQANDTKTKISSFPVACSASAVDCAAPGKLKELCPDSSKKSVIYCEENGGTTFLGFEHNNLKFRCNIRVVGWLNLNKLGITSCSWSAIAILNIIAALPAVPFNYIGKPYTRCKVVSISEAEKSAAIFSRYTYDEPVTQYLLYPYDYFALNISFEFTVPRSCISQLVLDNPINCPTL